MLSPGPSAPALPNRGREILDSFPLDGSGADSFRRGFVGAGFVANAKRLLKSNMAVFTTTGIQQVTQTCPCSCPTPAYAGATKWAGFSGVVGCLLIESEGIALAKHNASASFDGVKVEGAELAVTAKRKLAVTWCEPKNR